MYTYEVCTYITAHLDQVRGKHAVTGDNSFKSAFMALRYAALCFSSHAHTHMLTHMPFDRSALEPRHTYDTCNFDVEGHVLYLHLSCAPSQLLCLLLSILFTPLLLLSHKLCVECCSCCWYRCFTASCCCLCCCAGVHAADHLLSKHCRNSSVLCCFALSKSQLLTQAQLEFVLVSHLQHMIGAKR